MVADYIKEHKNHTEQSIIDLFKNNPELKKKRFSLNHNKRKNFTLND
jgi:hypothetical protein